ncbi:MAG: sporulation protein YunB [Cellulosilyticaceae bacterium]
MLRRRPIQYKSYNYPKSYTSYHRNNNISHKIQGMLAILSIIAIFSLIYIQLDKEVMPTVMAMAKMKATSIATEAINESISQTLASSQITVEDLLSYDYNDLGELISWNVNSILINNLCAEIVSKSTEELQNIGTVSFKIPLGNLTGSRIFANMGPDISVQVLPIGTMEIDYDNQIQSTGINQVNHTVWLDIEVTIQVVVPLFSEQVVVKRRVMLIDKVISGKVPPSYVNIPEQDILEVLPDGGME